MVGFSDRPQGEIQRDVRVVEFQRKIATARRPTQGVLEPGAVAFGDRQQRPERGRIAQAEDQPADDVGRRLIIAALHRREERCYHGGVGDLDTSAAHHHGHPGRRLPGPGASPRLSPGGFRRRPRSRLRLKRKPTEPVHARRIGDPEVLHPDVDAGLRIRGVDRQCCKSFQGGLKDSPASFMKAPHEKKTPHTNDARIVRPLPLGRLRSRLREYVAALPTLIRCPWETSKICCTNRAST